MNTTICDAPDSTLADMIGPVVLIWLQDVVGWKESVYLDGRRVIRDEPSDPGIWCLSELMPHFGEKRFDVWRIEVHDGCPWQ